MRERENPHKMRLARFRRKRGPSGKCTKTTKRKRTGDVDKVGVVVVSDSSYINIRRHMSVIVVIMVVWPGVCVRGWHRCTPGCTLRSRTRTGGCGSTARSDGWSFRTRPVRMHAHTHTHTHTYTHTRMHARARTHTQRKKTPDQYIVLWLNTHRHTQTHTNPPDQYS